MIQTEGEGKDPSAPDLQQAFLAHELIYGLSSLSSTIASAVEIVGESPSFLDSDDWQDLREHLESIQHEVNSQIFGALTYLAHRIPQFATGIQRPIIKCMRPGLLLLEMMRPYELRAAGRGISFYIDEESFGRMPAIEIEANLLRRIFHNVMSNALKYSYRGFKVQRSIRIWCRRHDSSGRLWALAFQNYGVGVLEDEKSLIFDPGYRGILARKESTFGNGLGLADVQHSMQAHGGRAEIDSKPQGGGAYLTTVTLVFPDTTNIRRHFSNVVSSLD